MAGFAIDIGEEGSAYAQGVAMPQATSLDVLTQGLSLFAPQPKEKPTEASIQRAAYGELATAVNGLRGLDPLKQRVEAQRIRSEYEMAGFVFGDDEASLFESVIGIDMATQGQLMNPEQAMLNQSLSYLEQNPGFILDARNYLKTTGEQFTQQDVVALAIQKSQAHQANLTYILNTTTTDRATFHSTWLPNAIASMDTVVNQATIMFDKEIAGGDVDPASLQALKGEWSKFKGNFLRPKGIENTDWQMFQDRVDAVDQMFKNLESYDADQLAMLKAEQAEYMTRMNLFLVDKAAKEDPMMAMAMWQNPEYFSQTYITSNFEDFKEFLARPDLLDGFKMDARPTVPTTTEDQADTPPPTTTLFDEDFLDTMAEKSDTELLDAFYDVTFNRVNFSNVDGMNDPTHRDNFLMGIGQASGILSEGGRIISQANLEKLFNEETYKKLAAIEKLDPEAAQLAREQMRAALFKQWDNLQSSVAGSLSNSPFNIVGLGVVEYDLDKKQGEGTLFQYTDKAMDLVRAAATKYYGGDATRMIVERGRNLDSIDRSAIEAEGFKFNNAYQEYRRVLRISNEGQYLIDYTKKLGFTTDLLEQSMIRSMEPARGSQPAAQTGGILPQIEDQNPLGYNAGNVSAGQVGVDPAAIEAAVQEALNYTDSNISVETKIGIARAIIETLSSTGLVGPQPDGRGMVPVAPASGANTVAPVGQITSSAIPPTGQTENDPIDLSPMAPAQGIQYIKDQLADGTYVSLDFTGAPRTYIVTREASPTKEGYTIIYLLDAQTGEYAAKLTEVKEGR